MMQAQIKSILDFIRSTTQFIVPIYQRNYAWGKEQCEQLWEDIIQSGENENIDKHFTGSVVYVQQGSSASVDSAWLLIDGQQRLTTTLLLLEALSRAMKADGDYAGLTPHKIKNIYLINEYETGEKRFKLLLAENDKDTLNYIISGKDISKINKELVQVSKTIINNYTYFTDKLKKADLETVAKGIAKLQIVDLSLAKGTDNPQLIFESMNSTGKSLSQSDLIRNYVLMDLDKEEQEELYTSYWRPMENLFGQENYDKYFDTFMRYFLITVNPSKKIKIDEVYDAFKRFKLSEDKTASEILSQVKTYAEYYTTIMYGRASKNEDINKTIKPIFNNISQELDLKVATPVMLMLYADYEDEKLTIFELKECLTILESFLFRRAIVEVPTNSLNSIFPMLISKINKDDYAKSFRHFLLGLEDYRRFPKNVEFTEALKNRDVYNMTTVKYLLSKLENYGRGKETLNIDECTIEHVLPQNEKMSKEWKAMLGDDYLEVWQVYLHRLGNLTITKYNSEYSDKPFNEKLNLTDKNGFGIGLANSPYNLNAFFRTTQTWNEEDIKARANLLASQALEIWKLPEL